VGERRRNNSELGIAAVGIPAGRLEIRAKVFSTMAFISITRADL